MHNCTHVAVTCWRPFCLFIAGVGPLAPLPWAPFTPLAFQVPFSAQKAYCGLNVLSASSSDAGSPSDAAQSESSSFASAVRRLNLCMARINLNMGNSPTQADSSKRASLGTHMINSLLECPVLPVSCHHATAGCTAQANDIIDCVQYNKTK